MNPKGNPPGITTLLARYASIPVERTRCFSIIAHIDHGKSTLADKLLESVHNIWPTTKGKQQVLDTLEVERQRGITVKAQTASMVWRNPKDDLDYLFNLIDTPGHVDFSYEVQRSLAACQGALLLVDASQGVQAQTVANYNAAVGAGLKIIPVLTKIDLPVADPEPCLTAMESAFGIPPDDVIWTSAKSGAGIDEIFPALVERIPPPQGAAGTIVPTSSSSSSPMPAGSAAAAAVAPPSGPAEDANALLRHSLPLRCILFDSWFDAYRGVVCSVLVVEGCIRPGDTVVASHSGDKFVVQEVGLMAPFKHAIGSNVPSTQVQQFQAIIKQVQQRHKGVGASASGASIAGISPQQLQLIQQVAHVQPAQSGDDPNAAAIQGGLAAGQVGYLIAGMKSTKQALVGDTFVLASRPVPPLPGFRPAKPMVFASLYPVDTGDFNALVTAVERLTLNDASVTVERESSGSLGLGLRCGFLGLLHMDVFHQRLQQEFSTPVIITAPMVPYKVKLFGDGKIITVERPSDFPEPPKVDRYYEPTAHLSIMTPTEFVSPLMGLLSDRRGVQEDIIYLNQSGLAAIASAAASTGAAPGSAPALPSQSGIGASENLSAGSGNSSWTDDTNARSGGIAVEDGGGDAEFDSDGDRDSDDESDGGHDDPDSENGKESRWGGNNKSLLEAGGSPISLSAASPRVVLKYRIPWAEVVADLYDSIKSMTQGYASLDWIPGDYQEAPIVKVDILINTKPVDALSFVTHKDKAAYEGRRVATKLRKVIDRQQFEIVIQAAIGSKIIARERIAPFRKDVLIKSGKTVGGGDRTRKMKLLEKQKEGKRRMKTVGNVQLSQEVFHSIMSSKDR
jgi:GTP-binding protein LepA